jgi:hypothetical protein
MVCIGMHTYIVMAMVSVWQIPIPKVDIKDCGLSMTQPIEPPSFFLVGALAPIETQTIEHQTYPYVLQELLHLLLLLTKILCKGTVEKSKSSFQGSFVISYYVFVGRDSTILPGLAMTG